MLRVHRTGVRLDKGAASATATALVLMTLAGSVSGQPLDGGAVDAISQGRELVVSGRPDEAIPLLLQAVRMSPDDPGAHYALAEAYFRSGDLPNALGSLRAASVRSSDPAFHQNVQTKAAAIEAMMAEQGIVATPASPQTLYPAQPYPAASEPPAEAGVRASPESGLGNDFDAADAALKTGDLDKAHILVLTGLRAEPDSARGNYLLGEILTGKKDLIGAQAAYQDALNGKNLPANRKEEIERKLLRIEVAMEPGFETSIGAQNAAAARPTVQPARAALSEDAAIEDSAYRSPINLAAARAAANDLPGAIGILQSHLAASPADARASLALAGYLHESGDDAGALEHAARALQLDSASDGARNLRIKILMARGDFGSALADLDALVVSGRATVTTYINRGVSNHRTGDLALALQDYDNALAMEPGNVAIYINKAAVLIEKRDEAGAVSVLTTAISRDGRSANAFLYRGMAYFNMGQMPSAIADFTSVLGLAPANRQALLYRAQAYKLGNALGPAVADLDRLVALEPSNTETLLLRGAYRAAMGQQREAIADYDRVLALKPGNSEAVSRRTLAMSEIAKAEMSTTAP